MIKNQNGRLDSRAQRFWLQAAALTFCVSALLLLTRQPRPVEAGGGQYRSPQDPKIDTASQDEPTKPAKLKFLFIGNSHTSFHDVPALVKKLVDHRMGKDHSIGSCKPVGFLDEAKDSWIDQKDWDAVVLQAQQISSSGKFNYPTNKGVEFAKKVNSKKRPVYFFSEWGIRNVPGHSKFTEDIYKAMANESGGRLIPVGRAWEAVLAENPQLKLYSADSNHQSRLGASLTALVIASYLLNEPATVFQDFDDPEADSDQWKMFIEKVAAMQAAEPDPKLEQSAGGG